VRHVQPVANIVKEHLFNALLYHAAPTDLKATFTSVKAQPRAGETSLQKDDPNFTDKWRGVGNAIVPPRGEYY
jgi:hypothetical protein